MNWVAIGAIGSLLSGILTPLAILIAYKTYKRDLKKSLVIFHSCSINDNNDIYNDKLYITIYNSGLRKIILTGIGFEEPVAWVAKHRLNPDRNNVNNFQNNVHFPIELQAEEHIDIVISLYQYMEWITRNIISSTLRSSRFKIYVKDGSRKFYYDKKDIIFNWNDEKIMEYYKYSPNSQIKNKRSCSTCERKNNKYLYFCHETDINDEENLCCNYLDNRIPPYEDYDYSR